MIPLSLRSGPLRVLCLGAHADDIEIGCGGTLLRLAERPQTSLSTIVLSALEVRRQEALAAAEEFFPGTDVTLGTMPDGRMPAHWLEIKEFLEAQAGGPSPDLILAPRPDDAHQDHRLLGKLVTTVWRDTLTLHYEIPKWDADLPVPTHYVGLTSELAHRKVELLNRAFPSQHSRDWWDDELFVGLMRVRGVECRNAYAEAFTCRKMEIDLGGAQQ
jgi:LmbE family N-acetylglucosaminyl deacetylase